MDRWFYIKNVRLNRKKNRPTDLKLSGRASTFKITAEKFSNSAGF